MNFTIGYKTDRGLERDSSEDRYKVFGRAELYQRQDALVVVADGMGGTLGGGVAADTVIQTFSEVTYEILVERYGDGSADPTRILRDFLSRANYDVLRRKAGSAYPHMGTTCVAALLRENRLTIGHVGDSRAYLLREGKLRQLTEDHSDVWQEVMAGNMRRDEARTSPLRNRINRYLGKPDVLPDVDTHLLQEGDTVLLCTDGLNSEVEDIQIAQILATAPDAQAACEQLVAEALKNGGSDNVTVVVLRYGAFTPLTLPSAVTTEDRDVEPLEEEDVTDPAQAWREKAAQTLATNGERPPARHATNGDLAPERRPVRPRPEPEEDDEDLDLPEPLGMSGLARTLLIVLAVLVIGQAIALALVLQRRNVPAPTVTPESAASSNATRPQTNRLPTDGPLDYLPPRVIFAGPLRDTPLLREFNDEMLAVTLEGKLVRIDPEGKTTLLSPIGPTTPEDLDAPHIRRSAPISEEPKTTRLVTMTLDASGNRYQLNVEKRTIEKYTPTGTRIKSDIGKGFLQAPAAFVVDSNGSIFIIDNRQLKQIPALPTRTAGKVKRDLSAPVPGVNAPL